MRHWLHVLAMMIFSFGFAMQMPMQGHMVWAEDSDSEDAEDDEDEAEDDDSGDDDSDDSSDDAQDDSDDDDRDDDEDDQEEARPTAPRQAAPAQPASPRQTRPARPAAPRQAAPTRPSAPSRRASSGTDAAPEPAAPRAALVPGRAYRSAEITGARLSARSLARLRAAGFTLIHQRDLSGLGQGLAARLATPAARAPSAALARARQIAPEAGFDLSHVYDASAGGYGRRIVGMPLAEPCLAGGRIGLIDGAIADHSALAAVDLTQKSFSGSAEAAHGTAVLSILAAAPPGTAAPLAETELFAASVFAGDLGARADVIDLAAALAWQVESGVPVVNMSLAGPENSVLRDAVAAASRAGLLIVAAAGNGGAEGGPRFPAAYEEVIAVAAVDARGRAYRHNSQGDYVDIAAPGVDVWGADARTGGSATWSGTSFAAPLVTLELAAAQMAGALDSPETARAYLARHARDLGPEGRDPQFGHGLLQSRACTR